MLEDLTVSTISTVGFPIVMSLWFMWRLEPLIKTNNEVLGVVAEHIRKKKN